jgi:hypothetical protein
MTNDNVEFGHVPPPPTAPAGLKNVRPPMKVIKRIGIESVVHMDAKFVTVDPRDKNFLIYEVPL